MPFTQHPVNAITQINPSITKAQVEELNGALTVCYDDYSEDHFDKRDIFVSDQCLCHVKLLEVQTCVMIYMM
jgi:hypothetical protein